MSFNISNVLTFETVCAEGSNERQCCVQVEVFCIDSGHPIGASSGVSLRSCRELTIRSLGGFHPFIGHEGPYVE